MNTPHKNKGRKQTPEQVRKRVESVARTKARWTDEQRKSFSEKIREANKDRDVELRNRFIYNSIGKEPWNKGKTCPQLSGSSHWNYGGKMSPESIEKIRKTLTGKKQTPELIQKRVAGRAGYSHSEETRRMISETNRMLFETGGRERPIGEKSPSWRGGISFEPYPLTWTFALREMIRTRDGRICSICGKEENGKRLDVHHIDYNKKNIEPDNLIALCVPCHRKTNYKRTYWEAVLKNSACSIEQRIAL